VANWGSFLKFDMLFCLKKAYVVRLLGIKSIIIKVLNQKYVGLCS